MEIGRRQLISALGGAAAWPLAARAQQTERMRRIGVLSGQAESDPEPKSWITAFSTRLRQLGWTDGENVRIDYRWAGGDLTRLAPLAQELVGLRPDALLAVTNSSALALRQYTLSIPIVFVQVGDPVSTGLVTNLARPNGNITGFTAFEFSVGNKWIHLLRECASFSRAAVFFDPATPDWAEYVRAIEVAAPSQGVKLIPFPVQNAAEIEHGFTGFAAEPHGAVIVIPSAAILRYRQTIIALAAQRGLATMYPYRFFAVEGGLISYGSDVAEQHRQAASYIDRILKGEKPADLPVQQPTKFELVINLKTAKALGITVPQSLLVAADEVIE